MWWNRDDHNSNSDHDFFGDEVEMKWTSSWTRTRYNIQRNNKGVHLTFLPILNRRSAIQNLTSVRVKLNPQMTGTGDTPHDLLRCQHISYPCKFCHSISGHLRTSWSLGSSYHFSDFLPLRLSPTYSAHATYIDGRAKNSEGVVVPPKNFTSITTAPWYQSFTTPPHLPTEIGSAQIFAPGLEHNRVSRLCPQENF